jgi:calcitonin receptor-like
MEAVCRDRYLQLPVTYFRLLSCSMCYKYLFYTGNHLQPHSQQPWTLVPTSNSELYSKNFSVIADVNDEPSKSLICDSLTEDDCTRWTDCCNAAMSCCAIQLSTPTSNRSESSYCPRTWDGYSCFGDTEAGTRTYFSCPSFVPHSDTSGM